MNRSESKRCAYCGATGTLTAEHLWPKSLHRKLANSEGEHIFGLAKIGPEKTLRSEPAIRDVCQPCNNGPLSLLDQYICELFDKSFSRIAQRYEKVIFEYDYHLLKRWLLKLCFNSARINSSVDLFAFAPLLPYILGDSTSVGRDILLYVQLTYPSEIPEHLLNPATSRPKIFYPTLNRVGHVWFEVPGEGQKLLRAVHLYAYSFYLAFFQKGARRSEAELFNKSFLGKSQGAILLQASRRRVQLLCDGMNAWESFYSARNTKIDTSIAVERETPSGSR